MAKSLFTSTRDQYLDKESMLYTMPLKTSLFNRSTIVVIIPHSDMQPIVACLITLFKLTFVRAEALQVGGHAQWSFAMSEEDADQDRKW